MSRKNDKPKPVSVYVRCRPRNANEKSIGSHSVIDCSKKEVVVKHGNNSINKKYTFDHVYGPESTQVDVYKGVAQATIEEVLQGYNCTVFAYGQTGTGKTYTMEGERTTGSNIPWDKDPKLGLIPRCMSHMFDRLNSQASDFSVRVSMLELYNEELFDLLSSNDSVKKLKLFEDSTRKGSVVIQGLEEVQVMTKDEVYALMERALLKRRTAETLLNAHSSRSHVVFTVTVHIKSMSQDDIGESEEEVFKMGKFNLVDLAGSENIGRSGALNARAREAGNINQSLLTLGRVITALVDRAPHIPYRESKLTRLLQDSLGGRTQTSIIATVSPAACNLEETLSTLDYANRAKSILNKPEVNQRSSKKALIKEYTAEIELLRRELQLSREKGGVYMDVGKFTEMENRMKSQTQIIKEKEDELSALIETRQKIDSLFSYSIKQIDGLHNKIDRKEIIETQNKTIINNFIQSTKNKYSMFDEFVAQQKDELISKNERISSLLTETKTTETQSREQTKTCLKQLMETVVKGLDTAVMQRDAQHESWLTKYFTDELIPMVESTMINVEKASNQSKKTVTSIVEMLVKDHDTVATKLDEMAEALKAITSSAETECSEVLKISKDKEKCLTALKNQRKQLLQESLEQQQRAIGELLEQFTSGLTRLQADGHDQLAEIQHMSNEAEQQISQSDQAVQENVSEMMMSLTHGHNCVLDYHVKFLSEQNNLKRKIIDEVQSSSSITSGILEESQRQCSELQQGVKRAKMEHTNQTSSSSSTSEHQTLLSFDEEHIPQVPHLRSIFDKRCEFDVVHLQQEHRKDSLLHVLAKETSTLIESSSAACQQSSGLINEAEVNLHDLKKHVKEDLPTGTTPKRAKLNRLKLEPSSDISLNVIESDDENTDPNSTPLLDMSY